ncbi:MAG: translation initiation factor IF-2 [Tannerella sp.]|jgi:translation initiation factor IF-2|nr:translation initiation factor IF-2 [Tannerella sp.]
MPVKLFKVIKDYNVGLQTVVDFLNKKGYVVDSDPNVRITDEQFELLAKEYGNNIILSKENKIVKPPTVSEKPPKEEPKKQEIKEIKTVIPEDIKIQFKTVGKIDLDGKKPKPVKGGTAQKVDTKTVAVERKPETTVNKDVTGASPAKETLKPETATKPETVAKKESVAKSEPVAKSDEPVVKTEASVKTEPPVKQESGASKPEPVEKVEQKGKATPKHVAPTTPVQKPAPASSPVKPVDGEVKKEPPREPKQLLKSEQKRQEGDRRPVGSDKPADKPQEVENRVKPVEEQIFRPSKPLLEPKIKVTGKIDLDAINQATSPRKKTKEEKKREHDERREKQLVQRKTLNRPAPPKVADDKTAVSNALILNKHKRKRIRKDRVDISTTPGTNFRRDDKDNKDKDKVKLQRPKRPIRVEVNNEDVQKQVKETLARLTSKNAKGKGAKYRREKRDAAAHREQELLEEEKRDSKVLKLTEFVTANDLANMMNVSVTQVISTCMSIGIIVSINQRLDAETINIVSEEFGYTTEYVSAEVVEAITEEEDNEEDLVTRPPIITVMGHVDHGKTSLLDNIRKTNVIAGEAGGITQHIGAYNVKLPNGRHITFLDTPGHEAFTAMRARGAKVTDIAIIIVAADDNVMPQTVEAINHASAVNVPIVFAINKIDKPQANPEKIKEELANMNYLVEDWGGKYQSQEISAKQGIGVPELLEKVLLEADMLDLKANPERRAVGSVIESSLDKGRGFVSTVLVSNGTLKQGDVVLAGTHFGRVKAMFNERNLRIDRAAPSEPALILGLDGAPQAGDTFNVLESEPEAREIASRREQLQRELGLRTQKRFGLEELGRRRALGDFHELNLIVKGDVDGSVEALSDSLIKLSTPEIQVNVIHKAVGQISESDISLAATASAVIIGFQVRPSVQARRLAENEGVEIRLYSIIYGAINEVRDAMEGMLSPEIREDICGEVEVQQVFKISKVGTIAGCIVKEGKIKRTNKVRVIRDGIVIYTGDLSSLKRFKDEAKEAVSGQDCGIFINNYNDVQVGDIIEPFDQVEIKKTL